MTEKRITVAEAAGQTRKSERTIRRWIVAGKLRAYRVAGFGILIDQADLDKLIRPIPAAEKP